MIYLIDEKRLGDFLDFCQNNPLALKIFSLYRCYGLNMPFLDFWLQYNNNDCVAVLMKLESAVTVIGSELSDTDELCSFVEAIGFLTLESNLPLSPENHIKKITVLMKYSGIKCTKPNIEYTISGSLYEAYDIMKSCENNTDFCVPPFDGFYVDMCHRIRHGGGECAIVYCNGQAVACTLATAVTDKYVLLGIVACRPEYRYQGFGRAAVQTLLSHFSDKTVFVQRDENNNREFYESIGFETYTSIFSVRRLK